MGEPKSFPLVEALAESISYIKHFYGFDYFGGPVGYPERIYWWGVAPGGAVYICNLEFTRFRQVDRQWWQRRIPNWQPFSWDEEGDCLVIK